MWFASYLWLLLCYSQYGRGNLLEDYEEITRNMLSPPEDKYSRALPVEIGKDKESGCLCRATKGRKTIVCFGNYECKKFPKPSWRCDNLLLRTTVIQEIHVGELDSLYFLKDLKLEANHQLSSIQPGAFQNLTELKNLTISYHTYLITLDKDVFRGLVNLEQLTLINNGFTSIVEIVPFFSPNNLPSLKILDLSKNPFEEILEDTFSAMEGAQLERLELNLCRIDFIHPKAFLPLKQLTHLGIGSNELNCSVIRGFLTEMSSHSINLTYLDLSDMGFRKIIPMKLLKLVANTTINTLMLAYNQFEILPNDAFPVMKNIQTINLRKVSAISIGADTFAPEKFPNLRILLLGENNLPGIHIKHVSNQQVRFLDLSGNKGPPSNPMYYEIDRDVFIKCVSLEILNLSFNRIKSIYDYTFTGLKKLKILNLENGTIYSIGSGTFLPLEHLENLNLANNPLTAHDNLTRAMFAGLNELKILNMMNCGLKRLYCDDNIFEVMPNLTHLILKNNQISYITDKLLKPLKLLQYLDLSENLMVAWWKPVFTTSGVHPQSVYFTNNKISLLTKFMINDLIYLLRSNLTLEIDFSDNVFVCDCSAMYKTYIALQGVYGGILKNYIENSNMLCSAPDVWEDRKVSEYLTTIRNLHCIVYNKISRIMLLVWTAPSLFTLIFISSIVIIIYKHRHYIKYWLFLAKVAVGRRFIKAPFKNEIISEVVYKYDAFVSYCNEDRDFVSEMVSNLEGTPPYLKLCVYERDFEIGSFISESILSSINESRYVLLVISENFAKSQWCRWETQLAEYHRLFLEDGTVYDPLLRIRSEVLVVRTTVIEEIRLGELDALYYLKSLKIEANHKLYNIQEGIFRNLTHLQQLSLSYNSNLESIQPHVFVGLKNLKELTFVNNGFSNIKIVTVALKPSILPALERLDLSENGFDTIAEDAFSCMSGTAVEKLDLNLCRIDYIHPNSFLPFRKLTQLSIGQNDLNSSLISDFILRLNDAGINLDSIDLSGMGFRKVPPRRLMQIIANTTIRKLLLADNQFEMITNDAFPRMNNIQMIDLRRVSALCIGSQAFSPAMFPNLRILMLGGNNLPGIHIKNVSDDQIVILDLSYNKGNAITPMYYDIDKEAFIKSRELRVLNLSYNRIKSIFEYTFRGLNKLKILNLENGTVYFIGPGTFKSLIHLEILNLANNPLTATANLTSSMFVGLNELKVLILKNCGIKHFHDDDNIFEMMPNLTRLILSNNQLYFVTPSVLKPLRSLKVLDLSENLLVSWWDPLFITAGIRPIKLYLANNKISQFTLAMVKDIDYLLNSKGNFAVEIQLLDNVFVCDCMSMYQSFLWLQTNGSEQLRRFFFQSEFLCSSPDVWEDKRVADFLSSIQRLRCLMYEKITSMMVLMWTAPTIISVMLATLLMISIYKYRMYIRYWLFLARIAIGRKFFHGLSGAKQEALQGISYKYDAFVSYCNEDRDFVSEMVAQLEHNPPFLKLCVYERDFEIGSFISESILASINSSKYIILIVSRNFAKSQWCRWETQLAEYHRLFLEDGTAYDPLLLIRLDDVDAKQLNTTLKFLLKTKIYLSWNEQQAEEFWKKLRNLLTKNR